MHFIDDVIREVEVLRQGKARFVFVYTAHARMFPETTSQTPPCLANVKKLAMLASMARYAVDKIAGRTPETVADSRDGLRALYSGVMADKSSSLATGSMEANLKSRWGGSTVFYIVLSESLAVRERRRLTFQKRFQHLKRNFLMLSSNFLLA